MAKNKNKENEMLVKQLYENYPYPCRQNISEKKVKQYVQWVSSIFGKELSFWKGKSILELGCGTGELANGLALCGARVHAIDFSSNSIKKAKEISKKLGTKVTFKQKNILEFKSKEKYDVVIALGSLHHTINARKGFHNGAMTIKKNGFVIIGLYNKFARFRHRVKRFVIWLLCGKNIEKRIVFGKRLFGGIESKAWLADKYGQVHESYHSVKEIKKWFKEEGISFIASKPKSTIPFLGEIKWFFEKKGAFFVMVGKR